MIWKSQKNLFDPFCWLKWVNLSICINMFVCMRMCLCILADCFDECDCVCIIASRHQCVSICSKTVVIQINTPETFTTIVTRGYTFTTIKPWLIFVRVLTSANQF